MIAPENGIIQIILGLAFIVASGYAIGRTHQWRRNGDERNQSYRAGYDRASRMMYELSPASRAQTPATDSRRTGSSGVAVSPSRTVGNGHAIQRLVTHAPGAVSVARVNATVGTGRRRIMATSSGVRVSRD